MKKPKSYMEFIFIDDDGNGWKTGVLAMFETDAKTWADFNSRREMAVSQEKANFLLDYHNSKGDLTDTIMMNKTGFELTSGERALSAAEYKAIDRKYWNDARSLREAA